MVGLCVIFQVVLFALTGLTNRAVSGNGEGPVSWSDQVECRRTRRITVHPHTPARYVVGTFGVEPVSGVRYSIVGGNEYFAIDHRKQLYLKRSIDLEHGRKLYFQVTVVHHRHRHQQQQQHHQQQQHQQRFDSVVGFITMEVVVTDWQHSVFNSTFSSAEVTRLHPDDVIFRVDHAALFDTAALSFRLIPLQPQLSQIYFLIDEQTSAVRLNPAVFSNPNKFNAISTWKKFVLQLVTCDATFSQHDSTILTISFENIAVCETDRSVNGCWIITWPRTLSGLSASVACPGGEGTVYRPCSPEDTSNRPGHWELPQYETSCRVQMDMNSSSGHSEPCTQQLHQLAVNVENILETLTDHIHQQNISASTLSSAMKSIDHVMASMWYLPQTVPSSVNIGNITLIPRQLQSVFENGRLEQPIITLKYEFIDVTVIDIEQEGDLPKNLINQLNYSEQDKILITNISIPDSLRRNLSSQSEGRMVLIVYKTSSLYNRLPAPSGLDAGVVSLSFRDLHVADLKESIHIQFVVKLSSSVLPLCVYYTEDGSWSSDGIETQISTEEGQLIVTCLSSHLTSFSVLFDPLAADFSSGHSQALTFISVSLSVLSVLALVATIVIYSVTNLLNQDGQSALLVQLCCSLLLLHLMFLLSHVTADSPSSVATGSCVASAVMIHYLVLVSLGWMLAEAFHIYQLLVNVFSSDRSWFLRKRIALCWGVPFIIVALTVAINHQKYTDAVNASACVISASQPLVYYLSFFVPGLAALVVNCVIFVIVIRVVVQPRKIGMASRRNPHLYKQVLGVLTVMSLLGVGWILGALQVGGARTFVAYLFVLVNGSQGLLIFLVRCVFYPPVRSHLVNTLPDTFHSFSKTTSTLKLNQSIDSSQSQPDVDDCHSKVVLLSVKHL